MSHIYSGILNDCTCYEQYLQRGANCHGDRSHCIPVCTVDIIPVRRTPKSTSQDVRTGSCSLSKKCLCVKPVWSIRSQVTLNYSLPMVLQMGCHTSANGFITRNLVPCVWVCCSHQDGERTLRIFRTSLPWAIWFRVFAPVNFFSHNSQPNTVNTADSPAVFRCVLFA